jgi:Fibronectin type III domain
MPVAQVAASNASAAQQEAAQREGKGGNFFSRKYGPLPGWGWSLLAAGGALAYFWWRSRSKNQAVSSGYTGTGVSGQLASLQSEIDALYGQSASAVTKTTGTTGTGGSGSGKPAVPGNLHTDRVTTTTAKVGWDKVSGATTYTVQLSGKGGITQPGTNHVFSGLKHDTTYSWQVRANNAKGSSAWATGSFKTKKRGERR